MKHSINKKYKKLADKQCFFCHCDNYNLLDCHRIIEGNQGGTYSKGNVVTCCSNCHRLIHSKEIIIDKFYNNTSGIPVLHYWINGEEYWKN